MIRHPQAQNTPDLPSLKVKLETALYFVPIAQLESAIERTITSRFILLFP